MKYQIVDASCGIPVDDNALYDTYEEAINAALEAAGVMIVEDPWDDEDTDVA